MPRSAPRSAYDALRQGATLLTATRFQADVLRHEFDRTCLAAGLRAWPSADVLPYPAWLERTYLDQDRDAAPLLLGGAQRRALWRRIIGGSGIDGIGGQLAGLVRRADEAWRQLHDWQIPLAALPSGEHGTEAVIFAGWARDFERACAAANWLDPARLAAWLQPRLAPQATLLLRGFAGDVPARTALLAACGATRQAPAAAEAPGALWQQPCADSATELAAAARWAQARLDREPDARIAIVLLDSRQMDAAAYRLRREFAMAGPELFAAAQDEMLARTESFARAFALLELEAKANPIERISALLTDPWLDAGSASARALFDAGLRRLPLLAVSLVWLAREARRQAPLADLERSLSTQLAELRGPHRRTLRDWAGCFSRILGAWRWQAGPDSRLAAAWEALLDELVSIDLVLPPQSKAAALRLLREQAERRLPATAALAAPVRLLSADDAIDLRHDYVWVCGLHEQGWPPPQRPQPWLPYALQRRAGMPQCDAAARWRLAQAQLAALLAGARGAVLSWPGRDGEAELRPAAALSGLPALAAPIARRPPPLWDRVATGAPLESFADPGPGPLRGAAPARGGAALLDDQSACPFRAVARHRLRAEPLDEPGPGLDARGRGQLLHAALQRCWHRLGTQQALLALDAVARRELVTQAIDDALAAAQHDWRIDFGPRFLALERGRLVLLLERWLDLEAQREPFTVAATEQTSHAHIGALVLRLRFDRCDALASGGQLIIDYKSGEPKTADWQGDRPRACQLPLYAITAPDVHGIAYACVSRRTFGFKGLVADGVAGPGLLVSNSWDEQLASWRAALERLAAEVHTGVATVTPQARACEYCPLDALCRIDEPRR
ncbi:MAG: PD-(D/E)XK nuclease family protein [Gammaproteobacteria bacterium]|nr:PD-(D/E)XK nuclease family protein [Gammaproteobacteria bacterium]